MKYRSFIGALWVGSALALGCDLETVEDSAETEAEALDSLTPRAFQLGTTYVVQNIQTGLCADVPWGSPSASVINQFPCHNGPAQQFTFNAFLGPLSTMRNVSSGECATVGGFSSGGYGVSQTTCNPSVFPQALEVKTQTNHADGATVVLNSAYDSGLCLEAPNTTASAPLRFERCDGGQAQRWRLRPPASPTCSGFCGGQSAGACWCDDACAGYGDCCDDYAQYCVDNGDGGDGGDDGGSPFCLGGQTCCEPDPNGGCWLCVPDGASCP